MENIKNTPEDIGKIVVRISNKLAFAYSWEPDHIFINDDNNNYRYATKEEETIYNTNKSPDDRFYSLYNAPELRHEILKERIEALHGVYKHISSDTMHKLITCDMSRQYWEHELNERKDNEIAALKKQVASLIKHKDSLTKTILNTPDSTTKKAKQHIIDAFNAAKFGSEYKSGREYYLTIYEKSTLTTGNKIQTT